MGKDRALREMVGKGREIIREMGNKMTSNKDIHITGETTDVASNMCPVIANVGVIIPIDRHETEIMRDHKADKAGDRGALIVNENKTTLQIEAGLRRN